MKQREQGFTFIEILVTIAILGLLTGTAIFNFKSFRWRAYDGVAFSDFRNTKTALYGDPSDDVEGLFYYYITSSGNGSGNYWAWDGSQWSGGSFQIGEQLPAPLQHIAFSEGTIPRIVYRYHNASLGYDYMYLWIDHQDSKHSYRMINYDSPWFQFRPDDQIIDKFPNG